MEINFFSSKAAKMALEEIKKRGGKLPYYLKWRERNYYSPFRERNWKDSTKSPVQYGKKKIKFYWSSFYTKFSPNRVKTYSEMWAYLKETRPTRRGK